MYIKSYKNGGIRLDIDETIQEIRKKISIYNVLGEEVFF
jgi:hypothetical protein